MYFVAEDLKCMDCGELWFTLSELAAIQYEQHRLACVDTTLNDAEQRYLIDVLQRNSFKFLIDDETGFWYFVQPKE